MTAIDLDHDAATAAPAPAAAAPSRAWLRRPALIVLAAFLAGAVGAAVGVSLRDAMAIDPPPPMPTIDIAVDGDVARSVGVVRYADGSLLPIHHGEGSYFGRPSFDQAPVMVSVSITAGFDAATCRITVNGAVVDSQVADGGGEVAMCSWVPTPSQK